MPAIEDFDEVNERFRELIQEIGGDRTEQAITRLLITVEGFALPITPIATSVLVNSFYRYVEPRGRGWRGEAGYGANYAEDVHESPGTSRGMNVPRSPPSLGFYWDPAGEPGFMQKAVDETLKVAESVLRAEYE